MASSSPSPTPSPSPSSTEVPTVTDAVSWWGQWILSDAPLRLIGIFLFAAIVNWVLDRLIRKVVKRAAETDNPLRRNTADDSQQMGLQRERRKQRAHAIGQLVRSVLAVFIWGSAVLMALPIFGLDITPLLASAGVVGVALGFGAQTLVKDYLSGIFMILEDQFGVGDFVDLGEAVGTVEEVTLRVTRLRDTSGIVWYVRNGEILRVANRSQGWTLAVIDIPVAYDQDLDEIQHIVDDVGQQMVDDPDSGVTEFSKPSFAGVESMSGEAVYVRIIAKTDPDQQVGLTRAIRQRLKAAFDAAKIKVPAVYRLPGSGPGGAAAGGTTPPPR
jgi:small conductance mechanosensitive channel